MKLINGECIQELNRLIKDGVKVDAIITDMPYGTTACAWDKIINNEELIPLLKQILKPNGRLVLFGNEPFYSLMVMDLIKSSAFV